MLRTAIYVRVSSSDQSVASQRHELREFIQHRRDLNLAGEYEDVISGTREKREQLAELLKAAKQRKLDAVVFFDLSRLTRKGISHAIELLDEFKRAGCKPICYAFPQLDFTDESGVGELIAALFAWQAQQERQMLSQRIKAGLAARKAKGLHVGRKPIPMDQKSAALRLRKTGMSFRAIAQRLSTKAKPISYNSVRNIVRERVYQLAFEERSEQQIAKELNLDVSTVKKYIES